MFVDSEDVNEEKKCNKVYSISGDKWKNRFNGSKEIILRGVFQKTCFISTFSHLEISKERSFFIVSLQNSFISVSPGLNVTGESFRQ